MREKSNVIGLNPALSIAGYQGISIIMFAATKVMFSICNYYWRDSISCFTLLKS